MAFKGGGGEAMDAFDEESPIMQRMMDGGGEIREMLQVALGWLQSFSLVALLEMEWPEWFKGFSLFTLDLSFTSDAGDWPSILIGLSACPILIMQLDHGLFVKRNDSYFVQNEVSNNERWVIRR